MIYDWGEARKTLKWLKFMFLKLISLRSVRNIRKISNHGIKSKAIRMFVVVAWSRSCESRRELKGWPEKDFISENRVSIKTKIDEFNLKKSSTELKISRGDDLMYHLSVNKPSHEPFSSLDKALLMHAINECSKSWMLAWISCHLKPLQSIKNFLSHLRCKSTGCQLKLHATE